AKSPPPPRGSGTGVAPYFEQIDPCKPPPPLPTYGGYQCVCANGLTVVNNKDGSQACVLEDVCGVFKMNPCGKGTCMNVGDGTYTCVCPTDFVLSQYSSGATTCIPRTTPPATTYVTQAGDSCYAIYSMFGLTHSDFLDQNEGVDCTNLQPGILLNVSAPNPALVCVTHYPISAADSLATDCTALEAKFGVNLTDLNPGLNCAQLIPGQQVCLERAMNVDGVSNYQLCTEYHGIAAGETCASIIAAASISWLTLYRLNPGLLCDNLNPLMQQERRTIGPEAMASSSFTVGAVRHDSSSAIATPRRDSRSVKALFVSCLSNKAGSPHLLSSPRSPLVTCVRRSSPPFESKPRSAHPNRVSWRTFAGLKPRERGEGEGGGGRGMELVISAIENHRRRLDKRARGRFRQPGAGATGGRGSSPSRVKFRARGGMQDDAWQAGGWSEESRGSGTSGGGAFGGLRDPLQSLSGARPSSAESDSLPADLRDRALSAVEALVAEPGRAAGGNQGGGSGRDRYGRVTVGDVAARSGLKVGDAEKTLKAFAADGEGFLEVSDEGDVLYVLPRNLRALIAQRSLRMRLAPMAAQAKAAAGYVMRVSFGTALVASVLVVYTSIFVLMTSAQGDSEERRGRGRGHYHRYRGPTFFFNIADLLWYWDPGYHRRVRSELQQREMSFLESVFSFVFGDGDPNDGREQHRWRLIGEVISSRGGVVAAQEIAPYLDLPEDLSNEAYMLPVLQRFQGTPSVDDQGHIFYAFPLLQRTAEQHATRTPSSFYSNSRAPAPIFVENTWSFSDAPPTKRALAVGLGIINVVGVLILSSMLRNPAVIRKAGLPLVSTIQRLMPALQAYSVAFFVIPLCRWAFLSSTNSAIETRNQRRRESAHILSHPSPHLRKKLASARLKAEQTVLGEERVIYSTQKDVAEQELEESEWDARLNKRQQL
ncbi:unnamed protein product, partial [Closterium sp. Yama58-4]